MVDSVEEKYVSFSRVLLDDARCSRAPLESRLRLWQEQVHEILSSGRKGMEEQIGSPLAILLPSSALVLQHLSTSINIYQHLSTHTHLTNQQNDQWRFAQK